MAQQLARSPYLIDALTIVARTTLRCERQHFLMDPSRQALLVRRPETSAQPSPIALLAAYELLTALL
ncbi:hypothetical protein ACYCVF_36425 [Bradyrhizobium sp. 1.29L]